MLQKKFLIILILASIVLVSGCIREGEACSNDGEKVKDQTGSTFECKDGKWVKMQMPVSKAVNDSLDKGITDDYYTRVYGNATPSQPTPIATTSTEATIATPATTSSPTIISTPEISSSTISPLYDTNGSKPKTTSSPTPPPSDSPTSSPTPTVAAKKYCGNNITELELGEICDPAGINLKQCPRPQYSGTCDNCKSCLPAPSSIINLSAILGISGGYSSADLSITLKDWNANKDPYWYDNATFQLYYTTESYNDPCTPTLVMYKQISNVKESEVNSGEWKITDKWQSSDIVIKYTGSDNQQHTTSTGAYTPPQGC
ncbi:MAG: hypothetical protein HY512_04465 [Candidatus Aenigmarchaeota archaeon]|nr:hypothetical protein [Candidatus Aenigmarchaeota archaeon]